MKRRLITAAFLAGFLTVNVFAHDLADAVTGSSATSTVTGHQSPTCTQVPLGTLTANLENRLLISTEAKVIDLDNNRNGAKSDHSSVYVNMEHVLEAGWECVTWSAEILLPPDTSIDSDGVTSYTGLARTATVEFVVNMDETTDSSEFAKRTTGYEERVMLAIVVIEVFNGRDTALHAPEVTDTQGRHHRRVEVGFKTQW